ncbi:hypothetical protein J0J21_22825, partial [Vibrio vulnificus]|uniref:hypothetical protein n=1 Tax=Vibrio vulnificus TaxID=672 RepID=UPI0019D442A8
NPTRYNPNQHQSRRLLTPTSDYAGWINWLIYREESDILWIVPWWKISCMTLNTFPHAVGIIGLQSSS